MRAEDTDYPERIKSFLQEGKIMPCPLRNCPVSASSLATIIPPRLMAGFVAFISAFALAGAFTAQYGFGLRPCELCLIQRVPFALNIALGLTALGWESKRIPLIGLSGFLFFVNSCIAFFHSGVERKWWTGLTGCTTPDMSGSIEEVLKRIQDTDVVRCDEIPWSLFGLSMANYNVAFCLGLAMLCGIYILCFRRYSK